MSRALLAVVAASALAAGGCGSTALTEDEAVDAAFAAASGAPDEPSGPDALAWPEPPTEGPDAIDQEALDRAIDEMRDRVAEVPSEEPTPAPLTVVYEASVSATTEGVEPRRVERVSGDTVVVWLPGRRPQQKFVVRREGGRVVARPAR